MENQRIVESMQCGQCTRAPVCFDRAKELEHCWLDKQYGGAHVNTKQNTNGAIYSFKCEPDHCVWLQF